MKKTSIDRRGNSVPFELFDEYTVCKHVRYSMIRWCTKWTGATKEWYFVFPIILPSSLATLCSLCYIKWLFVPQLSHEEVSIFIIIENTANPTALWFICRISKLGIQQPTETIVVWLIEIKNIAVSKVLISSKYKNALFVLFHYRFRRTCSAQNIQKRKPIYDSVKIQRARQLWL